MSLIQHALHSGADLRPRFPWRVIVHEEHVHGALLDDGVKGARSKWQSQHISHLPVNVRHALRIASVASASPVG